MLAFGMIGVAGYVAPRHMRAIKAIDGEMKVAFDPNDSVGTIDSYFPEADFFAEFERFARHLDNLRHRGEKLDWMSICSPNYLHDAHCRFSLRSGADVICEKPIVLNPWNLDALAKEQQATGGRIFTIMQLRLHPLIERLKAQVDASRGKTFNVDLTYITPRGRWYHASWKGNEEKSGGIGTNIGIHLFDALIHIFGLPMANVVHLRDPNRAPGMLITQQASIRWFLSIDRSDLPAGCKSSTLRSIVIDGEELDLSDGFADLHTRSYEEIIAGRGFGLETTRPSIELATRLRRARLEPHRGDWHPFVARHLSNMVRIPCARNKEVIGADSAAGVGANKQFA